MFPDNQPTLDNTPNGQTPQPAPPPVPGMPSQPQASPAPFNNSLPTAEPPKASIVRKLLTPKLLAVVGVAAVVIVAGIIAYATLFNKTALVDSNGVNLASVFDPEAPIPIKEDGKWGYISTTGEVLIKPQYKTISAFHGNYAKVNDGDKTVIIDKTGQVKLEDAAYVKTLTRSDIEYNDSGLWQAGNALYDADLRKLTADDIVVGRAAENNYWYYKKTAGTTPELGLLDPAGKIAYSCPTETCWNLYMSDVDLGFSDRYAVMKSSDNYQIINLKNKKVVYESEDEINTYDNNVFRVGEQKLFARGDEIVFKGGDDSEYCEDYTRTISGYVSRFCLYRNVIVIDDGTIYDVDTKQKKAEKVPDGYSDGSMAGIDKLNMLWRENGYKVDFDKISEKYTNPDIKPLPVGVFNYLKGKSGRALAFLEYNEGEPKNGIYPVTKGAVINLDTTEAVFSCDSFCSVLSQDSPIIVMQAETSSDDMQTKIESRKVIVYNGLTGEKLELQGDNSANSNPRIKVAAYPNYFTVYNYDNESTDFYNLDFKKIYTVRTND